MINARRQAGLVAMGALAWAGAAEAQTVPGAAGVGGTDRFTLDLRERISYESNVAGGNDTLAAIRSIHPSDVIYSTGATATFNLPSSRQSLSLTLQGDINRHQRNSNLDGENVSALLGATRQFSTCQVSGSLGYARRQSEPDELIVVAVRKNIAQTESASLSTGCAFGHIVTSVGGQYSNTRNSAGESGYVDSETEAVTASVGYGSQTLGTVSLFAQYSVSSYDDNSALGAGPVLARDFHQLGGGISYSRRIGLRLNGTASVSYTSLNSDIAGGDSSGLTASATLAYRLSSRTNLSLSYFRGDTASATLYATSQFSERVALSGSYRLSSRLSATAGPALRGIDIAASRRELCKLPKMKFTTSPAGFPIVLARTSLWASRPAIRSEARTSRCSTRTRKELLSASLIASDIRGRL